MDQPSATTGRRKPSWNSTTNDLTQYKLSPEELEEKQRTLKHRPLQDPAVLGLTRKQRPDGSWYVTGARPASAMSAATEDTTTRRGRATAQKPRSRSVPRRRALASDDEDAKENVRPRSRSRSRSSVGGQAVLERVERAIHLRQRVAAGSNGVGEKGPQEPDRAPARKNGAVATTASTSDDSSEIIEAPLPRGGADDCCNNSLNAEWDQIVLSEDLSFMEKTTPEHESHVPSDVLPVAHERRNASKESDTAIEGTRKWLDQAAERVGMSDKQEKKIVAKRCTAVPDVMGGLRTERDRQEREKASELRHLNAACEELRTRIVRYEFATGRHLQEPAPEPLERNAAKAGCYTEFLLKASTRLFEYLGDVEDSRQRVVADLDKVSASADAAHKEVAQLRAEMAAMRQDVAVQQLALQKQMLDRFSSFEAEQQSLAEQTACLFQSQEFQSVNSLLGNLLAPRPSPPPPPPHAQDESPATARARTLSPPTFSTSPVISTGSARGRSDAAGMSSQGPLGRHPEALDPLAMTSGGRLEQEEEEEEIYPMSPLSPQLSPAAGEQHLLPLHADNEDEEDDEEDTGREAESMGNAPLLPKSRVHLLKTLHRQPPMSPVQESPLESTPIREAVERMVAVGKMSTDEVELLAASGRMLASSAAVGAGEGTRVMGRRISASTVTTVAR